jgi:monofunctional biosynthetic peptidoglycan transglycosylase
MSTLTLQPFVEEPVTGAACTFLSNLGTGPRLSWMPSHEHFARVIDFSDPDEIARWSAADDVVMGGISSSRLGATEDGTALFIGTVSLENGGGFASVRSNAATRDLAGARALVVRVRGDGRTYKLRVRTTSSFEHGASYLASFPTEPETWQEIVLRPSDFVASRRGRVVPDAAPLDLREVQSFGLLISNRQAGPFALEVAWIAKL